MSSPKLSEATSSSDAKEKPSTSSRKRPAAVLLDPKTVSACSYRDCSLIIIDDSNFRKHLKEHFKHKESSAPVITHSTLRSLPEETNTETNEVEPKQMKKHTASISELLQEMIDKSYQITLDSEFRSVRKNNIKSRNNVFLESNGKYNFKPLDRPKLRLHRNFKQYLSTKSIVHSFSLDDVSKAYCKVRKISNYAKLTPSNTYRRNFFFSYDLFLFMQFFMRVPCNVLERIHSAHLGDIAQQYKRFQFRRCSEYCQDFTESSRLRTSLESDYKNDLVAPHKTWDFFSAQFNSTSDSILVLPSMSMSSFQNSRICNVPYPIFPSFLDVPSRNFYFIPIYLLLPTAIHCSVFRLDNFKKHVDVFNPTANKRSEDEFALMKHANTIVDLLNKIEFQYAYKSHDSSGRVQKKPSLNSKRLGNDQWVVGKLLRDANLPFSLHGTCLLNCLLFVDMHLPPKESLTRVREAKERVSHKRNAEEKQEDQLRSIVFYSEKTVTHAQFDFFNICRKAPSSNLYCTDCDKK